MSMVILGTSSIKHGGVRELGSAASVLFNMRLNNISVKLLLFSHLHTIYSSGAFFCPRQVQKIQSSLS